MSKKFFARVVISDETLKEIVGNELGGNKNLNLHITNIRRTFVDFSRASCFFRLSINRSQVKKRDANCPLIAVSVSSAIRISHTARPYDRRDRLPVVKLQRRDCKNTNVGFAPRRFAIITGSPDG